MDPPLMMMSVWRVVVPPPVKTVMVEVTGVAPLLRVSVEVSVMVVEAGKVGQTSQEGMMVIVVVSGGRVQLTYSVHQSVIVSGVQSPSV
jgi:hypothetical protein